jgi:hypothetical protein
MPPFATVWAMGSDMLRGSASGDGGEAKLTTGLGVTAGPA